MTPEAKVKAAVKKVLGDYERWGYVWSNWPVPGGFVRPTLDCIAAIQGLAFAIETKAPGAKPTARQDLEIDCLREAGVAVFVIDGDTSELERWLEHVVSFSDPASP